LRVAQETAGNQVVFGLPNWHLLDRFWTERVLLSRTVLSDGLLAVAVFRPEGREDQGLPERVLADAQGQGVAGGGIGVLDFLHVSLPRRYGELLLLLQIVERAMNGRIDKAFAKAAPGLGVICATGRRRNSSSQ
jgi:hypothetical protein